MPGPDVPILVDAAHYAAGCVAFVQGFVSPSVCWLWILHGYVFDRFPITPRLALLSPIRACGKTTLLVLIDL